MHTYRKKWTTETEWVIEQIRDDGWVRRVDPGHAGYLAWAAAHDPPEILWGEPVPPTLEALKAAKREELSSAFDSHVKGSFLCSLGYPMQFDTRDSLLVRGAIELLVATGQPAGYLTDANDATHPDVAVSEMQTVLLEMVAEFAKAHSLKQTLRAAADMAATAEEVEAIAWPT